MPAVAEVWASVDKVSEELSAEIGSPLRFGIGVHCGVSVVEALGLPEEATIQFLGDTGNVAARLEDLTKENELRRNRIRRHGRCYRSAVPLMATGGGGGPRPRSAAPCVHDPPP